MDKNITLYQITNVMAEKVFQKIDHFNKGRREDTGYYAISVSTPYRSYYALWRIFPDNSHSPLFVRTLAVTFDDAAERAFLYLQNCNIMLKVKITVSLSLITALPKILWLSVNTEANGWPRCIMSTLIMCYGWLINLKPEILAIRSWL